ncbi:unnamed protein product [Microthlaspi erraticum]|uniref:Uncharacterized protein n=1 Tax=Microthlaspi erraticum TaxID=1685480 RepID=A0A6D2HVL0_9BRAS|nr:unnamed protein product [Microthlaspi erraticum]
MCKQLLLRVGEFFRREWYHQEATRTLRFKRRRSQSTLKLRRVEKESVEPEKQKDSAPSRQKETRRGGKLFLFLHHSSQCYLFQHVSRNKWQRNAESFDQQLSEMIEDPF